MWSADGNHTKRNEVLMITIDRQLVFAARQLITGANVHSINTLIFQYEQSVAMKNDDQARFVIDPQEYERKLRAFVYTQRNEKGR